MSEHQHEDQAPGVVGPEVLVVHPSVVVFFVFRDHVVALVLHELVEFRYEAWGHQHSGFRGVVGNGLGFDITFQRIQIKKMDVGIETL